ncbi:MAG: alcohol dehydrogenase catalytic domain-containing protein [Clostridiales bacterium]|nr:alcohol dehydrogenase catalytic domain-containing protein [Clostridiales bacterium]
MINTVYRLAAPRRFEIAFEDMDLCGGVIVRPTHLSICNADMRYYLGERDAAVLSKKLPMALIHEGIGSVVFDSSGSFKVGERVAIVPNMPCENDEIIAENYLYTSKFCGSTADGLLQEYMKVSPARLVRLPAGTNPNVAAFTEMVSVAAHAIARFEKTAHARRGVIGVWGDGNLGYITSLVLKKTQPGSRVLVFGTSPEKLADFTFADGVYPVNNMPAGICVDHAFECVGGGASGSAIDQIIDIINPEGLISIMGVSEYPVPINTRMVLEKGLRISGSSRSGIRDFERAVELYAKFPEIEGYLGNIIGSVNTINSVQDIKEAFEKDARKSFGKTIMVWK